MDDNKAKFASKKILIVDDQGSIRSVFKLVLQELGFEQIDSATDGADAIEHLRSVAYDLVICDWNMPKMPLSTSGFNPFLKQKNGALSTVPFGK